MNTEDFNIIYRIRDSINEKDRNIKLKKLYELLQYLTKKLIKKEYKDFPTNISELLYFLGNIPMKEYIDDETLEGVAIDRYLDLTEEFLEIVSEENVEEAGQKLMYQLLKYIRESTIEHKEELYRKIKKFIIDNYYISVRDLEVEVKRSFGIDIFKMIRKMYENADDINGEYLVCPVCGRELNLQDNKEGKCSKVCNYYINKYNMKAEKKNFKNRILRLNEGVYRFNLMSSIGEFKIYERCIERFKRKEVTLYPNVDEYDISIEDNDKNILINLDVKDARTPERLVKILINNTNLNKLVNKSSRVINFIVIPEHREFIYNINNNGKYVKELKKLLVNENIDISVISERQLYKEIERIFQEA